MKKAVITGCTGQDGSYLAELLLSLDYEVHGLKRRSSSLNTERIDHLYEDSHDANPRLFLHYADLTDGSSLASILYDLNPDEIYNLGAQSHVKVSFEIPEFTADVVACGTLRLLEAIRRTRVKCRFYQASSSEMFGSARAPQSENTVFHPRSPYACAKVFAHNITVNYRESYGLHASCGILFNHESPRRGETFVTRKITRAVARIHRGQQQRLYLGNLDAKRDWGHARDYVDGMWRIVQQPEPDDYVLATGETHTVREFVELAFAEIGRGIEWRGTGVGEQGVDAERGDVLVRVDPRYFRPAEVELLHGNPAKARAKLGWWHRTAFAELVREMVRADLGATRRRVTRELELA